MKAHCRTVEKLVLVADICSSTQILQHLLDEEQEDRWQSLLSALESFLKGERRNLKFQVYKFIGDGWILLFPPNPPGRDLFAFLKRFCTKFNELYDSTIKDAISAKIPIVGISFGLERGKLIKLRMDSGPEYVGRALNVATRLQASIRDKDAPQGKVMMSNKVYESFELSVMFRHRVDEAKRKLRGIDHEYYARKLWLFERAKKLVF